MLVPEDISLEVTIRPRDHAGKVVLVTAHQDSDYHSDERKENEEKTLIKENNNKMAALRPFDIYYRRRFLFSKMEIEMETSVQRETFDEAKFYREPDTPRSTPLNARYSEYPVPNTLTIRSVVFPFRSSSTRLCTCCMV